MPFITEEIWQRIKTLAGSEGDTIMLSAYPEADNSKLDPQAETDISWLKEVIVGIRNIRGEMNISPAKALPVFLKNGSPNDQRCVQENEPFLKTLAKLESITWLTDTDNAPMSATALVGDMEILVPMAGLIDKDAEIGRLNKEIEKLTKDLSRIDGKLNNPKFMDKAPADVIAKEKEKQAGQQSALNKLEEQLENIRAL